MVSDNVNHSILSEQSFKTPVSSIENVPQLHVVDMPTKDSLHSLTETERKLYDRIVGKVNKHIMMQDIIGCHDAKIELNNCLKPFDIYRGRGVKRTQSVLLFGAPGTGKTELARAVANSYLTAGNHFFNINTSNIVSK